MGSGEKGIVCLGIGEYVRLIISSGVSVCAQIFVALSALVSARRRLKRAHGMDVMTVPSWITEDTVSQRGRMLVKGIASSSCKPFALCPKPTLIQVQIQIMLSRSALWVVSPSSCASTSCRVRSTARSWEQQHRHEFMECR